jgi:hypothetical protein
MSVIIRHTLPPPSSSRGRRNSFYLGAVRSLSWICVLITVREVAMSCSVALQRVCPDICLQLAMCIMEGVDGWFILACMLFRA